MGSWKKKKKSNWAKPPWLTRELKPNRILFPYHLSSIHPSLLVALVGAGSLCFLPPPRNPKPGNQSSGGGGVQETCSLPDTETITNLKHWNYHKAQAVGFQTTLKRWVLARPALLLLSLSIQDSLISHNNITCNCRQFNAISERLCGVRVISEILLQFSMVKIVTPPPAQHERWKFKV
jgi:hypothetical protein